MQPWHQNYPSHIPHEINAQQLGNSIAEKLEATCQQWGDLPAVTCMGSTLTFTRLEQLADQFASFLVNDLKLKKGDRLAIMLPNTLQFPIAYFGAQKAGIVCVNTNPLYTPREMQHQFSDSAADAILILDLFMDKLESIIGKTKIKHIIVTSLGDQLSCVKGTLINTLLKITGKVPKSKLTAIRFNTALEKGKDKNYSKPQLAHNDIAMLQYTGGTTGVAKGAILTQGNILANMEQIRLWAANVLDEPGEKNVLTALPLYHIFALTVNFLSFLAIGCHMILIPKPTPIKNTVKMFKKYRINALTGVNTLYNAMNNDPTFQKLAPRSIKVALAGGMALQQSVTKSWEKITGKPIIEGFGLTETSPVTHCNIVNGSNPPNSVGLPLPSTQAKIVDENGNELAAGEIGELAIKGPQVMQGYWQRPEETAKVLKDGWLYTGDIAKRDEHGFFYIVDRKKDMILVSGFNVYPNEVEEVLAAHPKVLEAAVIGVGDGQTGEAVKAFVVKKDESLTEAELRSYCNEQLTNYKRPKVYEFRKDLPKTNVGKILRKDLREENKQA